MARILERLLNWADRPQTRALERYLAQSANVSDLERRMREWESTQGGRVYLQ
jgi:hypothetical protein